MKKIISCKLNKGHYKAQACIVWCFDDRFSKALDSFAKSCHFDNFDLVKVAGGAKVLAIPGDSSEKDFILRQIKTSISLHKTDIVVIMTHSDCGAYGGLKSFGNNEETEKRFHEEELRSALAFLRAALLSDESIPKNVSVEAIFVDFENIFRI